MNCANALSTPYNDKCEICGDFVETHFVNIFIDIFDDIHRGYSFGINMTIVLVQQETIVRNDEPIINNDLY